MSSPHETPPRNINWLVWAWFVVLALIIGAVAVGFWYFSDLRSTLSSGTSSPVPRVEYLATRWGYDVPSGAELRTDVHTPPSFHGDGIYLQIIDVPLSADALVVSAERLGVPTPLEDCTKMEPILKELDVEGLSFSDLIGDLSVVLTENFSTAWFIFRDGQIVILEDRI